MRILLTGAAGFIGRNLINALLQDPTVQIDALDIKHIPILHERIHPIEENVVSFTISPTKVPDIIVHLAGLSGVRQSDADPLSYMDSNVKGTTNIFEQARIHGISKIIYASSSSVYGNTPTLPLSETMRLPSPKSVYSLTKQFKEQIAQYYYERHGIRSIGLRFFTVYGPHGRPDMAVAKFVAQIRKRELITIYGDGTQKRDFTYVSDIVRGIISAVQNTTIACDVFNLGSGVFTTVNEMVGYIEETLDISANIQYAPPNAADVKETLADITKARDLLGYSPSIMLRDGIQSYIQNIPKRRAFVSALIADAPFDIPGKFQRLPDWDYILFTNISFQPEQTSWTIRQVSRDPSLYSVTQSRLYKFNLYDILSSEYDTIVYMDALYSPIPNGALWNSICDHLATNDIVVRHHHAKTPYEECRNIQNAMKATPAQVSRMVAWLRERGLPENKQIPTYENNVFAYSLSNPRVRTLFNDIWQFLKPNNIIHRDQPVHWYYCNVYNIKTIPFPLYPLVKTGLSGNHTYTSTPSVPNTGVVNVRKSGPLRFLRRR